MVENDNCFGNCRRDGMNREIRKKYEAVVSCCGGRWRGISDQCGEAFRPRNQASRGTVLGSYLRVSQSTEFNSNITSFY